MSNAKKDVESIGFEDRLARLESLVDSMRQGDIGLEKATECFEEGLRLARGLEKDLAKIERRVEILTNEPTAPEEKPILELFPELERPN